MPRKKVSTQDSPFPEVPSRPGKAFAAAPKPTAKPRPSIGSVPPGKSKLNAAEKKHIVGKYKTEVLGVSHSTRSTRSQTRQLKNQDAVKNIKVEHFGTDVSSFVESAKDQGGSLDADSRHTMHGRIRKLALAGTELKDVVPGFVAEHIAAHKKRKVDVHQDDLRVFPRTGQSYTGHQLTSTRVNPWHDATAKDKIITQPLSPRPGRKHDQYDRSHASPFRLVGDRSNTAHTVWAPHWANLTVDGHIEQKALALAHKGHSVFHFRFDTDTHSTVGFVAKRHDKEKPFESFAANYKRR